MIFFQIVPSIRQDMSKHTDNFWLFDIMYFVQSENVWPERSNHIHFINGKEKIGEAVLFHLGLTFKLR